MKLIFGFCVLLATAASCPKEKEANDGVAIEETAVVEEATVVDGDYSIPDLTIDYKSDKAIDKLKELRQMLDHRLEMQYPNEGDRLYEFYRMQHEKLLEQLNNENEKLIEAYSETYNYKKNKYMLTDSIKNALKPFTEAGMQITSVEEETFFETVPNYYLDAFKDAPLGEDYKDYIRLEADGRNATYPKDLLAMHKKKGERVIDWENFLVKYHESDLYIYEEAKRTYREKLISYLLGSEDEPLYDPDEMTIRPEFKKSFEYLMAKYPKSTTNKLIAFFLEKLKISENGDVSEVIEKESDHYFNREP